MKKKRLFVLVCLLASITLNACGFTEDLDAKSTRIAAEIFATQTAEAPPATPTPLPTSTFTSTPTPTLTPTSTMARGEASDSLSPLKTSIPTPTAITLPSARAIDEANLRSGPGINYPVVGTSESGDTWQITGRNASAEWWQIITADGQTAWINTELVEVSHIEEVPEVAAPPPPPALSTAEGATPTPSQQWILVTDSATDFANPTQGWSYHWSKGRNNFNWQDMPKMPNDCFHSPNDMTLEICRDTLTVDNRSRGDTALQWQAPQSGTYRFEWSANEVRGQSSIWFYNHLNRVHNLTSGVELPYRATVENVNQYHQFFFLPQYDTPYRIKIYRLQG